MRYRLLLVVAALALFVAIPQAAEDQPKRVDPSLAEDVQDVVFFGDSRPVLIRLHIFIDGKPFQTYWESCLKELFQYLDRDNNGSLDRREAERGPSPQQIMQPMTGRFQPQTGGAQFRDMAADPSKDKVTLEEFIAYYRKAGAGGILEASSAGRGPQSDALTDALFKYLDVDKDGKLSKDELSNAATLLRKLDENDNELISIQELLPGGVVNQPQPQPRPGTSDASTFLVVTREESRNRLTERLKVAKEILGRYDKNKDEALSREEFAVDKETFDLLDENKNGSLNTIELLRWLILTPDIELTVRLGKLGEKEAAVEMTRTGGKDSPLASAVSKASHGGVMMSFGDAHLDLRRLEGRPNTVTNYYRQLYVQQFKAAVGNKGYVEQNDVRANRYPYLSAVLDIADRDGDFKLTETELNAYLDLQDKIAVSFIGLTRTDNGRGLFELVDANRDGNLSVRELKTMWTRLASYDSSRSGEITRSQIPRQFQLTLSQGQPNAVVNPPGMVVGNPRQLAPQPAPVSTRGPLWFRKMDRNGDGDVSLREFLGSREDFDRIDTDKDGVISVEEAEAADAWMRKQQQKQ